jgi:hypothetical protein
MRAIVLSTIAITLALLLTSGTAMAQRYEVNPYAGGFFPGDWAQLTKLKAEGLYGARAGVFATENIEIEGNFAYINQFKFKNVGLANRAFLVDVNASYNFPVKRLNRFEPFLTFGMGAMTTDVRGGSGNTSTTLLVPSNIAPDTKLGPLVLKDGSTFFAMNYGGGVKGLRMWGPLGFRADIRGRSLPNFYGRSNHWLETTGGITLAWGER